MHKMEYSVKPKDIGKSVSGKNSQKRFIITKKFATDVIKTALRRVFQKVAGATDDLIDNKVFDNITNPSSHHRKML